ncbi:hypothetical protein QO002_006070 [Pararhizobium capsulatum DSM 1112]|uniref:Uncharacterized protein n=1 Tax=Pararhizobium capsulatum DSM 1112 TaxID=1121113 RepID=A0ABU0C012_9HYPH|nr:hypothetical protein [Pararhizobium capsulatum DSM 1112]
MTTETKRRPRGASPRGEFEQSKTIAHEIIDERREADRRKSERLKSARLATLKPESSHEAS